MPISRDEYRLKLVGAMVVLVIVLFAFSLTQAGLVREWLNPSNSLRLVLPDEGLFGLAQGAKVEILGTPAGSVERIVIDPRQKIHAEVRIDPAMAPFVRKDSRAIIRKTFGVAGEGYLEITRGYEEEMDWDYAVLNAEPDKAPTEGIGEMLEEVRSRVIPILTQAQRALTALADLTEQLADPEGSLQSMLGDVSAVTGRIEQGDGSIGRLLRDDKSTREFEQLLAGAKQSVNALRPILEETQATMNEITGMARSINAQSKDLPQISANVQSILASLDTVMVDLQATTPELPRIARNFSATTANIPVLLGMTQQTLAELEGLLRQLRNSWLIGGDGAQGPAGGRLPASELRP